MAERTDGMIGADSGGLAGSEGMDDGADRPMLEGLGKHSCGAQRKEVLGNGWDLPGRMITVPAVADLNADVAVPGGVLRFTRALSPFANGRGRGPDRRLTVERYDQVL